MVPIDLDALKKVQEMAVRPGVTCPQFSLDVELGLRIMALRPSLSAEEAVIEARKMLHKRKEDEAARALGKEGREE